MLDYALKPSQIFLLALSVWVDRSSCPQADRKVRINAMTLSMPISPI
jgi:hypothetical protein